MAEGAAAGSPSFGEDLTVSTRASDEPLSHGHFPGPPGSDRGWEQVSLPDTGGNPVKGTEAVAGSGERVFYRVSGGTPISHTGTFFTPLFAERTANGWRSENLFPQRDELTATSWLPPVGKTDLSDQLASNFDLVSSSTSIWRMRPGMPAQKVFQPSPANYSGPVLVSEDASRALVFLKGSLDPAHPTSNNAPNLYDVTPGTPQLIGLLPNDSVPVCGSGRGLSSEVSFASHWVSPDGSMVFFPVPKGTGANCSSESTLYLRELGDEQTKLVSGPVVSGPECGAAFLKSTPGAAFFWTQSRLTPADSVPSGCGEGRRDGDVYRYDTGDGQLTCVTCVAAGQDADVEVGQVAASTIAVAADGSRVYFSSPSSLLPGAPGGVYRVDVQSGDLAFVASVGEVGEEAARGEAITPNGSAIIFASAQASLNALNGLQNGGTKQFYRYDDEDHSLTCLSCPQDGSLPASAVNSQLIAITDQVGGANQTAVSADGKVFAFAATSPLVGADQNSSKKEPSAGGDVYEWRDGRLFLVTDGLTNWPEGSAPEVSSVTPSGHDIFFVAAAQYTPDALDGYRRLYDARIGGGFEFPTPPPPCPLEVCQGTPKGEPEEATSGTSSFGGPGNIKTQAAKKHRRKKSSKKDHKHRKHHAKQHRRKAR